MNDPSRINNSPIPTQNISTESTVNPEEKNQAVVSENIQEIIAGLFTQTGTTPFDKLSTKSIERFVDKSIEIEENKEQHQYDIQKLFLRYVFWGVVIVAILLVLVAVVCAIRGNEEVLRLLIVGVSCFFGGTAWNKWKE